MLAASNRGDRTEDTPAGGLVAARWMTGGRLTACNTRRLKIALNLNTVIQKLHEVTGSDETIRLLRRWPASDVGRAVLWFKYTQPRQLDQLRRTRNHGFWPASGARRVQFAHPDATVACVNRRRFSIVMTYSRACQRPSAVQPARQDHHYLNNMLPRHGAAVAGAVPSKTVCSC